MEIIDLVSSSERLQKIEDNEVLVVANVHNKSVENTEGDHKRDDLEEHQEKHQKKDQDDEEIQQKKKNSIGSYTVR